MDLSQFLAESFSNNQNTNDFVKILEEFFMSDQITIDLRTQIEGPDYDPDDFEHDDSETVRLFESLQILCYSVFYYQELKKIIVCDSKFYHRLINNQKIVEKLSNIKKE